MGKRHPILIWCALFCSAFMLLGCGSEDVPTHSGRTALVCDWLNSRLDLIDLAELDGATTRSDVLVRSLDLSEYAQGPLNAEVTPDGTMALVSLSSGFFTIPAAGILVGARTIPSGAGRVLFIDLERFEVVGEVDTGRAPMGIAFVEDGTRAVIADFDGTELSIVDLASRTVVEQAPIGIYGEEMALDESGEVGIVSYSAAGNVRTFGTDDVAGTLSPGVDIPQSDAAGVAFFPGTRVAYVVQALMPLLGARAGYSLIDVTDPTSPVLLANERFEETIISYPAATASGRGTVIVPGTRPDGTLLIEEIELDASQQSISVRQTVELDSSDAPLGAYGAVVDSSDRVLVSRPGDRALSVVDLDAGTAFTIDWQGELAGPADVAIIPEQPEAM